jgi:hypothetical protein
MPLGYLFCVDLVTERALTMLVYSNEDTGAQTFPVRES